MLVGLGMGRRLFTSPRFSELTDGTLVTLGMRPLDYAIVGLDVLTAVIAFSGKPVNAALIYQNN